MEGIIGVTAQSRPEGSLSVWGTKNTTCFNSDFFNAEQFYVYELATYSFVNYLFKCLVHFLCSFKGIWGCLCVQKNFLCWWKYSEMFCIYTDQCGTLSTREPETWECTEVLNCTWYLILTNLKNLRAKTIKLLDKNMGVNLCDLGFAQAIIALLIFWPFVLFIIGGVRSVEIFSYIYGFISLCGSITFCFMY